MRFNTMAQGDGDTGASDDGAPSRCDCMEQHFKDGRHHPQCAVSVRLSGLPYPWCLQPDTCRTRMSCPRDPNCGE